MWNRGPTQHDPFRRYLSAEVGGWRQSGHRRHLHNIRDSSAPAVFIQHRNGVENPRVGILHEKYPRKIIYVGRLHLRSRLRRFARLSASSGKLGCRNICYRIRALVHYGSRTSANPSGTQVTHGEAVRGFGGHGPIEKHAVAFAHSSQVCNRLGKLQRRRLRRAGHPATDK